MPSIYVLVLAGLILMKLTEVAAISWWLVFGWAIAPLFICVIAILVLANR
jgi:hypothetical protein